MHQNTGSVAFSAYLPTIPQALSPQERQPPALVVLHFAAKAKGKRLGRPRKAVDRSRIARLRRSGASWAAIGRELGVGEGTVRRAAR